MALSENFFFVRMFWSFMNYSFVIEPSNNDNEYSGRVRFRIVRDSRAVRRPVHLLDHDFRALLQQMFVSMSYRQRTPRDRFAVAIRRPDGGRAVWTNFFELGDWSPDIVINAINHQSGDQIAILGSFFDWYWSTPGQGGAYYDAVFPEEFIKKKKAIVCIRGDFCFWQCLVLALSSPEDYGRLVKHPIDRLELARDFGGEPVVLLADVPRLSREYGINIYVIESRNKEFILSHDLLY